MCLGSQGKVVQELGPHTDHPLSNLLALGWTGTALSNCCHWESEPVDDDLFTTSCQINKSNLETLDNIMS